VDVSSCQKGFIPSIEKIVIAASNTRFCVGKKKQMQMGKCIEHVRGEQRKTRHAFDGLPRTLIAIPVLATIHHYGNAHRIAATFDADAMCIGLK
jgi:hypothetical protein